MTLIVGLLVVGVGVVSAAAISHGSVGYIRVFLDWPPALLTDAGHSRHGDDRRLGHRGIGHARGRHDAHRDRRALLIVVGAGLIAKPESLPAIAHTVMPDLEPAVWLGVLSAGLIAFFAFIGFEGIVNVAEEVKDPTVTLRRAIYLTLIIATVLYIAVAAVSVVIVPPAELGQSRRRSPSSSSARRAPRRDGSAPSPSSPRSTVSSCRSSWPRA